MLFERKCYKDEVRNKDLLSNIYMKYMLRENIIMHEDRFINILKSYFQYLCIFVFLALMVFAAGILGYIFIAQVIMFINMYVWKLGWQSSIGRGQYQGGTFRG